MHEPVDAQQLRRSVLDEDPREYGCAGHAKVAPRDGERRRENRGPRRYEHEPIERKDREPPVADPAETDDRRGEVAVHDPRQPVSRVIVLQQRLGARRDNHRARRDQREHADGRGCAAKRRCEREDEERQQRDQKARSGHPTAERECGGMPRRVPDELDDDERRDQPGFSAEAAPPEKNAARRSGRDHRCEDEQAALAQQQLEEDAKARNALAEEPRRLPAAGRTLARRPRVREPEWIAESPRVEREERQQSDEPACSVRSETPQPRRSRRRIEPDQHCRDRERQIDCDGESCCCTRARDAEPRGAAASEQIEGEERERRSRDVREEQRREGENQRREAEDRGRGRAEPRLDPFHGAAHEHE